MKKGHSSFFLCTPGFRLSRKSRQNWNGWINHRGTSFMRLRYIQSVTVSGWTALRYILAHT